MTRMWRIYTLQILSLLFFFTPPFPWCILVSKVYNNINSIITSFILTIFNLIINIRDTIGDIFTEFYIYHFLCCFINFTVWFLKDKWCFPPTILNLTQGIFLHLHSGLGVIDTYTVMNLCPRIIYISSILLQYYLIPPGIRLLTTYSTPVDLCLRLLSYGPLLTLFLTSLYRYSVPYGS